MKNWRIGMMLGALALLPLGCATTHETAGWTRWPGVSEGTQVSQAVEAMARGRLLEAESGLTMAVRATDPTAALMYADIAALRGNAPVAFDRYVEFFAHHGDSVWAPVAASNLADTAESLLTQATWARVASLYSRDAYAQSRIVALQARALRAVGTAETRHPSAVGLTGFGWTGPVSAYPVTDFEDGLSADGVGDDPFWYPRDNRTMMKAVRDGVYIGETAVALDRDGEVMFVVQSRQMYEVFVDGVSVLRHGLDAVGRDGVSAVRVNLGAGTHGVRVRIGVQGNPSGQEIFALWASTPEMGAQSDGAAQRDAWGLREVDAQEVRGEGRVTDIRPVNLGSVLGKTITEMPSDVLKLWYGAQLALNDGAATVADAMLQKRLGESPDDVVAQRLMIRRYMLDADMAPGLRHEHALTWMEKVAQAGPELGVVTLQHIGSLLNRNQAKAALGLWEKRAGDLPETPQSALIQNALFKALGWMPMAETYLQKAVDLNPDACATRVQALELQGQRHAYWPYASLPDSARACPGVIRLYAAREGDDSALGESFWVNETEKLAERYPNRPDFLFLSLVQRAQSAPEEVSRRFLEHLDGVKRGFYPDVPTETALAILDGIRAASREDVADVVLARLMELEPANESYQNLAWRLEHVRPLETLRQDGMKVIRDYLQRNDPQEGASVVILDYAATRFYPNGAKLGLTHIISRVLSKEGKNAVGEIYLPNGATVLKIRTIKGDTLESIEPESIGFKDSVTAPNLAVGDFVETEYLTWDPPPRQRDGRTFSDGFIYGSESTPILRSEYVYEYPRDWDVNVVESGPSGEIRRDCTPDGEFVHCTAYRENIAPFVSQPNDPSMTDLIPNIELYHRWGWEEVKRALLESTTRQTRETEYVRNFYKSLNVPESNSVYERAKNIYYEVIKHIDESEATHASDDDTATNTVTRGVGSRLVVLKSIYKLAGIPSYFALVRSVTAPENSTNLPQRYNSAYATYLVVDTERGPAYVDPSEDFMPFDYLPTALQNAEVIPIATDRENHISRVDETETIRPTIDIVYDILPDGTAHASSTEQMRGSRALIMRGVLTSLKGDDTRTHLIIQNSLARNYGRITLTKLEHDGLDTPETPLTLRYDFDIARFATVDSKSIDINSSIFGYKLVEQFANLPASLRTHPVLIASDVISRRELTFRAPEGYTWNPSTLRDADIHTKFGHFTRRLSIENNTLRLVDEIEVRPQRVELSEYPEFREFCSTVDEAQRTVLMAEQ